MKWGWPDCEQAFADVTRTEQGPRRAGRRLFAASEARAYGHGGVSVVSRITGIARSTIVRGVREIKEKVQVGSGRIRQAGGGRKAKCFDDRTLLPDLERLVEPDTRAIRCARYAGHPRVCGIWRRPSKPGVIRCVRM